jgi:hypothetical protein
MPGPIRGITGTPRLTGLIRLEAPDSRSGHHWRAIPARHSRLIHGLGMCQCDILSSANKRAGKEKPRTSRSPSPDTLPEQYGVPTPKTHQCLGEMGTDSQFCISDTAIRIDARWGVWLDPDAVVSFTQDQKTPVVVLGNSSGFTVDLRYAKKTLGKFWIPSMIISFVDHGFIPACGVM